MAADAILSVELVADVEEFNRKMKTVPTVIEDMQRKLLAYKDLSKNALDPNIAAKYKQKFVETERELHKLGATGKVTFDTVGAAAVKSSGGFQKAYSGLREIANILPGIGIGGLVGLALGPLMDYIQTLDLLKDKLSQTQIAQKVLGEAMTSSEYTDALKNVSELTINIDLAKNGLLSKTGVLDQYNETIGKTTGQVTSLDQAERELTKNGDAYIRITLLKAAAQLALDQAAKKAFEAAQKRNQTDDEALGVIDSYLFSNPKLAQVKKDAAARRKKEASDALIKDQKDLEAIARDLQTKAAKDSATNGFSFFDKKETKKPRSKREVNPFLGIEPQSITKIAEEFKAAEGEIVISTDSITGKIGEIDDRIKDIDLKAIYKELAAQNNMLADSFESAFSSIGDSIGSAMLNGSSILESFGQSALSSIGGILVQFGKLAIAAGVASTALGRALSNPFNPGNGIAAIAAGVALVAIGGLVKGFASNIGGGSDSGSAAPRKIRGFASGGTNISGGLAWVGENGPELVNLPQGSDVIPNHRLGQISPGGSTINVVATVGVKMGQLVVGIEQEKRVRGRTI